MSVEDKIKVIRLVLMATHAGSGRVDMKKNFPKLQLPSDFGRMIGKNLDPTKLTFVYEYHWIASPKIRRKVVRAGSIRHVLANCHRQESLQTEL
jgi:hypothetical protein